MLDLKKMRLSLWPKASAKGALELDSKSDIHFITASVNKTDTHVTDRNMKNFVSLQKVQKKFCSHIA